MSAGMIPALDLPGEAMPGQFGPTMRVRVALRARVGPEHRRVVHRDALGDHDDQRHPRVDRLDHRGLGAGRRHEHHRDVGAGGRHGLGDRAEDRDLRAGQLDRLARLARVGAADHLVPGREHAARRACGPPSR